MIESPRFAEALAARRLETACPPSLEDLDSEEDLMALSEPSADSGERPMKSEGLADGSADSWPSEIPASRQRHQIRPAGCRTDAAPPLVLPAPSPRLSSDPHQHPLPGPGPFSRPCFPDQGPAGRPCQKTCRGEATWSSRPETRKPLLQRLHAKDRKVLRVLHPDLRWVCFGPERYCEVGEGGPVAVPRLATAEASGRRLTRGADLQGFRTALRRVEMHR